MPAKKDYEEIELDLSEVNELMDQQLPNPTLLEYYRMLDERKIVWNDIVTDGILNVAMHILKWNKDDRGLPIEDREPIRIYINTCGGDLDSVMLLTNVISLSKTPVYTIGMGIAYSAGGLLLMAGHKRYVFEGTSVLIHDGSTGAMGDFSKVVDAVNFIKRSDDRVKGYIIGKTKISRELLEKNSRMDWFLFADEAVELGVADEIVSDLDTIS